LELNSFKAAVVPAGKTDNIPEKASRGVASLPIGLSSDTFNPDSGTALQNIRVLFDSHKTGIPAFQNLPADFMCSDIQNWGKLAGCLLDIFDGPRFGKNDFFPVARRKHPAFGIENNASLRLPYLQGLLLCETQFGIMVVPVILQIKTPRRQQAERDDKKYQEKNGNTSVFQLSIIAIRFVKTLRNCGRINETLQLQLPGAEFLF
jgi:hypothetical protein